jgi:hypothetical protein
MPAQNRANGILGVHGVVGTDGIHGTLGIDGVHGTDGRDGMLTYRHADRRVRHFQSNDLVDGFSETEKKFAAAGDRRPCAAHN